jgi:putative phage-type endonuclease
MNAPQPGSPEWVRLVSSSKIPAILGLSPWQSPFALWHEMKGTAPRDDRDTAAMRRGNYLEAGVIAWWLDQHPEVTEHHPQHVARLEDWGIATLDAIAVTTDGDVDLEVKTTSSWDEWGEPGTDQIPVHYLAQVLWQIALTNVARAHIAVLGPFLDFREYVIERDDYAEDIEATVKAARRFYDSLDADEPPPLDDHVATIATLRRLHPDIDRGQVAVIDEDLAAEYVAADLAAREADARKRAAQALVLNAAGDAQYIESTSGLRVARRQPGRSGVSLVRVAKAVPNGAAA